MSRARAGAPRRARRVMDRRGTPTDAEQRELVRRWRRGDASARDELVCRNLGLVGHVVAKYGGGPELQEDLFQEGVIGLLKAVDQYDPDRAARFGTYAGFWIRERALQYLVSRARTIRIPAHLEWGSSPNPQLEAAAERVRRGTMSLSQELTPGWDLEASLVDRSAEHADAAAELADELDRLLAAMSELPEDHREILAARYGMDGQVRATYREIGSRRGVSYEAVRKTEQKVMDRLRKLMV